MPAYKDDKRGTWYCSFYYTDWTGKKKIKKKRGFARKKEALDFEREFRNKESASPDMTFASLVDIYFADKETRIRETTFDGKKNIFDTKILPVFANMKINEIEASHVRHWQNDLISQNYAPTYLRTINSQLSAIFNFAVQYYNLPKNPVQTAGSIGQKDAKEMQIWTIDEFKQFIQFVDKPGMNLAFKILFWTGLRIGEVLALFPKDILETKIIDVNKTTTRRKGIDKFYDPKTDNSCRKVPIPEFLYEEILSYMDKLYGLQDDDQIFYFAKSTMNSALTRYAEKAGVKKIRVHDLRHSHASLLIEMDQPILLISQRLGHKSVTTTWKTYAHLYPHKGIALAEELQKLKF